MGSKNRTDRISCAHAASSDPRRDAVVCWVISLNPRSHLGLKKICPVYSWAATCLAVLDNLRENTPRLTFHQWISMRPGRGSGNSTWEFGSPAQNAPFHRGLSAREIEGYGHVGAPNGQRLFVGLASALCANLRAPSPALSMLAVATSADPASRFRPAPALRLRNPSPGRTTTCAQPTAAHHRQRRDCRRGNRSHHKWRRPEQTLRSMNRPNRDRRPFSTGWHARRRAFYDSYPNRAKAKPANDSAPSHFRHLSGRPIKNDREQSRQPLAGTRNPRRCKC